MNALHPISLREQVSGAKTSSDGTHVIHLDVVRAERNGDVLGPLRLSKERPLASAANASTDATAIEYIAGPDTIGGLGAGARQNRFGIVVSGVLSLTLHVALAGYLIWQPPAVTIGIGGQELEAVSIEIVAASAMESSAANPAAASLGAQPSDNTPGPVDPIDLPEVSAASSAPKQVPPPAEALAKPDPQPLKEAEIPAADVIKQKPVEKPQEEPKQKPNEETGKDLQRVTAQVAQIAGGTIAQGRDETIDAEGSAGASPGQLARYAMAVRLALGKTRPKYQGDRGLVSIQFVVSQAGDVLFAEIAKTSGSGRLDEAALSAIRNTHLPQPPTGMTERQRTYVVPFDFK